MLLLALLACTPTGAIKLPDPVDTGDSGDSGDSGVPTDTGDSDDSGDSGVPAETGDSDVPTDDTSAVDEDRDGFSAGEDCDDADGGVHPGAVEVCDAIDNDCDGRVDTSDPDLVDAVTAWPDADGDGWGADTGGLIACAIPVGYSGGSGDCDDTNADVNPDAVEVCDDLDDDCDGLTDHRDPDCTGVPIWYEDLDGDGYGNPDVTQDACDEHDGWVSDSTDCDDTDASTHTCAASCADTTLSPVGWQTDVPRDEPITARFAVDLDPSTLDASTFLAYDAIHGFLPGTVTYDSGSRTATLVLDDPASAGQKITAVVTSSVRDVDGHVVGPLSWTWTAAADAGTGTITIRDRWTTGDYTYGVWPIELDGDATAELAVVDNEGGAVEFLDDSGAGYSTSLTVGVGANPVNAAAADVEGDGDVDLIVVERGADRVEILLNDGAGGMTLSPTAVPVRSTPRVIVAGDVDGDGDIDAVVGSEGEQYVSVLTNDGAGTFTVTDELPTSGASPHPPQLGDMDADCDLDVVVPIRVGNTIDVLWNDAGALTQGPSTAVGSYPHAAYLDDLDGDGLPDVAFPLQFGGAFGVLLGDGAGGFASGDSEALNVGVEVCGADFDADADIDLVFASYDDSQVYWFRNDGSANFAAWDDHDIGDPGTGVACADIDGDGAVDIIASGGDSGGASTLLVLSNAP